MFEKTLNDLVTGIRNHKRDTALFISQNIAQIKNEVQSPDFFTKSNALQKLTFLQMMGYTMSWAAFAAVEVMSSPRFALKRIGYLAACQGLDQPDRSPVVLLTTNLLKKELRGATVGGSGENMYHAGVAINCLSNIVTEDLGRELLPDLLHLLKHPSPYVRKKALLCLYKVFLKYPQGLRLSFDQIKLCLEDSHPSVVSCAVNVITELSDKNPKNYLPLAPAFFKLLTSSANNWMLIKVVKLLGSLVPEEPRLARKLLDPLSNIVKSTHAKSLLYEAVYAITLCLPYVKKSNGSQPSNFPVVIDLCVDTLRNFVSDPDQNLKYLGLVGFGSLLQCQPKVLHSHSECRGLILKCLSDEDVTIRTRALGLLQFMTTQRNLVDLITQLLRHVEAASGEYRCDLVEEIIRMCSSNKYELVMDFAWYMDVLVILAGVRGVESKGEAIAKQWMDVAWRVLPVRSYAVRRSLEVFVCRGPGAEGVTDGKESDRHVIPEVLPAAAWIVGEYSHLIPEALENEGLDPRYDESSKGPYHALIQSMTAPTDAAGVNPLSMTTQAVFVQNAMKLFAAACERNQQTQNNHGISLDQLECTDEELYACADTLMTNLVIYSESPDVEVKERAFTAYQLLLSIGLPPDVSALTTTAASIASKCQTASSMLTYLLTPEPMKPISAKAQKRKLAEGPPSPVSVQEWEQDVNWDAFPFLNEETPWFDREGNVKGSVESICFTKQQSKTTAKEGRGGTNLDGGFMGMEQIGSTVGGTETSSFGGAMESGALDSAMGSTNLPSSTHQRGGDPFYLSSSATPTGKLVDTSGSGDADKAAKDAADAAANRFGSIQLDSGGDSDEGYSGVKSKKKKKKKARKAAGLKHQNFVESDDDDGDNVPQPKRGTVSKAFQNLALVDLTTPLGEDDVMPRNEHYIVPERPVEPKSTPIKAKKKKAKAKSKKSQRSSAAVAVEGDLLGFDSIAFGSAGGSIGANDSNVVVESMPAPSSSDNPINNAFDDLLGLEMTPSAIESSNTVLVQTAEAFPEEKAEKSKAKKQKKDKRKKSKKKSA
mmetsp:Transcript_13321/g.28903  ORF Transcript_13321/g.28903 Transcript_13321/m.28903 type:complete len:1049 (+) Transcript_13321:206-3352(+)|eukprot:CAMPEP_0172318492 /NCGR_PEP_ID=MMETSP1058-20130122/35056_1 /TAXON_ID=83371 /ORGANISM="Detonula confervacea, Strain CCMP 353" /LENGTH=1048 /DNA_ID=CAMNT_0013033341 /DNA_START=183 /DNA_END=3329 /DNA_ORIENTATION=-